MCRGRGYAKRKIGECDRRRTLNCSDYTLGECASTRVCKWLGLLLDWQSPIRHKYCGCANHLYVHIWIVWLAPAKRATTKKVRFFSVPKWNLNKNEKEKPQWISICARCTSSTQYGIWAFLWPCESKTRNHMTEHHKIDQKCEISSFLGTKLLIYLTCNGRPDQHKGEIQKLYVRWAINKRLIRFVFDRISSNFRGWFSFPMLINEFPFIFRWHIFLGCFGDFLVVSSFSLRTNGQQFFFQTPLTTKTQIELCVFSVEMNW